MEAWWLEVKSECEQSGHLDIAISIFGRVLFNAPKNDDGFWIADPVAKLLEEESSLEMRNGFMRAIFNSRGVYYGSRGDAEKKLSEEFKNRADFTEDRGFPRLAAIKRFSGII